MSKFRIIWLSDNYAESVVWAKNAEEARKKALDFEDEEFKRFDSSPCDKKDWRILKLTEVRNDFQKD